MDVFDVRPDDEFRHAPGHDAGWSESWYLDFFRADGTLGGYVNLVLWPNLGVSWYQASLVGVGRPLVTVVEHEAPLPVPPGLELRTSGLWAEVIAQGPLDHMTVGLEAFGVGLDDPTEMYRSGWGDRTPLGFDLEWETETAGPPFGATWTDGGDYQIPCRVHGEILVADETIDLDGWGHRSHRWGVRDLWGQPWSWSAGRLHDGTAFHLSVEPEGVGGFLGSDLCVGGGMDAVAGDDGLVVTAIVECGDRRLEVVPRLWAPVLASADGRRATQIGRALCEVPNEPFSGWAWLEIGQPQ